MVAAARAATHHSRDKILKSQVKTQDPLVLGHFEAASPD